MPEVKCPKCKSYKVYVRSKSGETITLVCSACGNVFKYTPPPKPKPRRFKAPTKWDIRKMGEFWKGIEKQTGIPTGRVEEEITYPTKPPPTPPMEKMFEAREEIEKEMEKRKLEEERKKIAEEVISRVKKPSPPEKPIPPTTHPEFWEEAMEYQKRKKLPPPKEMLKFSKKEVEEFEKSFKPSFREKVKRFFGKPTKPEEISKKTWEKVMKRMEEELPRKVTKKEAPPPGPWAPEQKPMVGKPTEEEVIWRKKLIRKKGKGEREKEVIEGMGTFFEKAEKEALEEYEKTLRGKKAKMERELKKALGEEEVKTVPTTPTPKVVTTPTVTTTIPTPTIPREETPTPRPPSEPPAAGWFKKKCTNHRCGVRYETYIPWINNCPYCGSELWGGKVGRWAYAFFISLIFAWVLSYGINKSWIIILFILFIIMGLATLAKA